MTIISNEECKSSLNEKLEGQEVLKSKMNKALPQGERQIEDHIRFHTKDRIV